MNANPRRRTMETVQCQRGQMLVVLSLAMVTLLMVAGLVIDGGVAFVNRRQAQNIADLGSVAGTKILADAFITGTAATGAQVYAAIDANVVTNGCQATAPVPCTWTASYVDKTELVVGAVTNGGTIPPSAQGLLVHTTRQPATYLIGAIPYMIGAPGRDAWQVAADATALTARITTAPVGQLLPIAANPPQPYVAGQTYNLTEGAPYGPGNFGWLSWTGSNQTKDLANSVCEPSNPALTLPMFVPGVPGAHNSKDLRDCLQEWVDKGATVLVPIMDICSPCNGNGAQYRIIGIAAFVLTGFDQPAVGAVEGNFVGYYNLPSGGGFGGPPSPADPTAFVGLIR